MKSCSQCGSESPVAAKFCPECGERFVAAIVGQPSDASAAGSDATSPISDNPKAVFEAYVTSQKPEEASSKLTSSIGMNRAQLKSQGVPLPKATNPILISLMDSLKALPSTEISARIAIVTALGRMADPAVLPPLLLVTGAQSKDVRRATAFALGCIRHPLSAYLLLPMLLDGSSRVKQAAFQGLIQLNQPHTMESILAACPCSKSLRSLVVETLRLVSDSKRSEFLGRLAESTADQDPNLKIIADWLRFEFKDAVTKSAPSTQQQNGNAGSKAPQERRTPQNQPATKSREPERREPEHRATNQAAKAQESSIFEWSKSDQPASAAFTQSFQANPAVNGLPAQNNYELTADFGQDDDYESDVRLTVDSNSSAADLDFFNSITQSLDDSHADQYSESDMAFASSGSQAFMSLSGMLPAPEIPQQRYAQAARSPQSSGSPSYPSASQDHAMQNPWSAPQMQTPNSAFDMATMSGNTPAYSMSNTPMMQNGGMPANGMYPPGMSASGMHSHGMPANGASPSGMVQPGMMQPGMMQPGMMQPGMMQPGMMQPGMMQPGMMQPGMMQPGMMQPGMMQPGMMQPGMMQPGTAAVVPAFDMTASSPLIPAFTNITTHPANTAAAIVSSQSSPSIVASNGQQAPQSVVVANIALPATEEPAVDEIALEKARAAAAHQKALTRLSDARAVAIRSLLKDADDIPSKLPRLLTKRIATLMSTPAKKMDLVIQQILDLGTTNSPAALSTLASFSQKPAKVIRQACAEAMGSISHPGSAVLLLKMLADKSGTVVEAAIKSLAKLDLEPVRPVLLAAGLCGSSLRTVVTVGVESATVDKKPEWERLLLETLQGDDEELTAFGVALLARIAGETHLDMFQKLTSHKAPVLRAAAVEALGRTQAKRAISQINNALEDDDATVRAQAALAVATMHSPRSIELLQKLVFDNNLVVRRNSAQSMSRIEEPALADVICSALDKETDGTTVEYLLAALQKNGGESSLPILQRYIEGEGSQFREQAVKALRKLKIPASVPVFRRLLDDHAPALRRHGIEQLTVLKCDGVLPTFREMLKNDPDETVRSACAKALGEFGDETSLHLLEEALEDHSTVRLQAVISLGRMGESSAGPTLLTMLQDQLPEIRYQAVRALAQLKLDGCEESVVPLLQDADQMVRRGAEQTLQDLGMTVSQIRRRRARKRFVSLAAMLAPSSVAGLIPGGAKSLLAVIVAVMLVGGYWGISKMSFVMAGGEKLPVGWIVGLDVNARNKITAALREDSVLDIWSLEDSSLVARVSVPETTRGVLVEPKGGILLLMANELGRLDPEANYDPEKLEKVELPGVPSTVTFHDASGSLCFFYKGPTSTSLKVIDPATLKETRSFTINGQFEGSCTIGSDFSVAITLDGKGMLRLADLKTGDVVSESVSNIVGASVQLGQVYAATFTGDMKHIVFCAKGGCVVMDVGNLQMVAKIDSPDPYGFINAKPTNNASDLVILSASGVVYNVTNKFETVVQSRIERDESFDLSAVSGGGELVAVANTEGYDFDVYSVKEKKTLMKSTQ